MRNKKEKEIIIINIRKIIIGEKGDNSLRIIGVKIVMTFVVKNEYKRK
jgi:hypothetical protein